MKWFVLLLLALGVVIWLRRRSQGPAQATRAVRRELQPPAGNGAFRGVSIKPGKGACEAAKALVGTRYLQSEAPAIPLPDCTTAKCDCHYNYHGDRRTDEDRRAPYSIRTELYGSTDQPDRRSARRDRRKGPG